MLVRQAKYQDLPSIYFTASSAFRLDPFQNALFPYLKEYPQDFERAKRHQILESYWDYSNVFAVSCDVDRESGKEVIKAVSIWKRHGDGWESLWGIKGRWDPRLWIKPILVAMHSLHRKLFPNRASIRPTPTNPKPLTAWTWLDAVIPYAAKYFTPPSLVAVATGQMNITTTPVTTTVQHAPSAPAPVPSHDNPPQAAPPTHSRPPFWELAVLATVPSSHGQGHGRKLVHAGLARARTDNLPCVVVASENKEGFYQRSGFWNLVGWATDGDDNPVRSFGVGGGAILWTEGPGGPNEVTTGDGVGGKMEEKEVVVTGVGVSESASASRSIEPTVGADSTSKTPAA